MEIIENTFNGYVKSAGAVLTAAQIEQFKTYLKQQRDSIESSMKMSAQMYGAQTTQASDAKKSK